MNLNQPRKEELVLSSFLHHISIPFSNPLEEAKYLCIKGFLFLFFLLVIYYLKPSFLDGGLSFFMKKKVITSCLLLILCMPNKKLGISSLYEHFWTNAFHDLWIIFSLSFFFWKNNVTLLNYNLIKIVVFEFWNVTFIL